MHLDRKHVLKVVLRDSIVILIGVPVVLAAVILYAEKGPFPWMPSAPWWLLAGLTGALLWQVGRLYRRHRREVSFWLNITWLISLHLAAWSVVLRRLPERGLGFWMMMGGMGEVALFVLVLQKLGYDPG